MKERTLVVADLHLGKSAAFRAGGLPVPEGDAERDLLRVEALVKETGAAALVVAGDLFHSATGMTEEIEGLLDLFLQRIGVAVSLVIGNHDRKTGRHKKQEEKYGRWECYDSSQTDFR